MKDIVKVTLAALIGLATVGSARADLWDKKTNITVGEAMTVPNATLQPGSYVVRLADIGSSRHIVQFLDKDEKHVITTILAIPNERLRPTGKSVFAFWEVPAGQPKALRAWFYPGDNFGQEFAYPKDEATRISQNNKGAKVPESEEKPGDLAKNVPADTSADKNDTASSAPAPTTAEDRSTVIAQQTPPPAVTPVPAQQPPAPAVTTAPSDTQNRLNDDAQRRANDDAQRTTAATPAQQELPKTASNAPLVGLIGLMALGAALVLKFAYLRE